MRRILAAAGLAACFALWSSAAASAGVKIGGEGHDRKAGCHGLLCLPVDQVIEKVAPVVVTPTNQPPPPASANPQTPPPPTSTTTQVCVYKFNDANSNGIRDWNEIPLGSWNFMINGPIGAVPMSPTGPGGGSCLITLFAPGVYQISETMQPGWLATTAGGAIQSFTIVPGHNVVITFGNRHVPLPQLGTVCVTKYNDLNGNGVRDSNETVLPGWLFTVKNAAGQIVDFGTTNAQGVFCTTHPLAAGTATVSESLASGWVSTDPGGAIPTKSVTVVNGQTTNTVFGNRVTPPPAGQICVSKYNDLNLDGARTSNEPMLSGWQFTIAGPSGPLTLTTGSNGTACTPLSLTPGSYVVTETMQSGWFSTSPGGTAPQRTVTVASGAAGTPLLFGNAHSGPGQICAEKYEDLNINGLFDTGEPMLAGWQFTVTGPSGPIALTTGSNGIACTPQSLTPGAYVVTETMFAGWSSVTPGGPTPHRSVTVIAGPSSGAQQFGNTHAAPGQICVQKYNDLNHNGRLDAGEPPMANWAFEVRNAAGNVIANGVTGADGRYCTYSNLSPGTYSVSETSQPGWVVTDPLGPPMVSPPWKKSVTLTALRGAGVTFGNTKSGTLCVFKYNDLNGNGVQDNGEPGLPGWSFRTRYTQWDAITENVITTDASGSACIELPPGPLQQIDEVQQPGWISTDPPPVMVGQTAWTHKVYSIVAGQVTKVSIGNRQPSPGPVCIVKYNDTNRNGVRDPGEWQIPGFHFTIKTSAGAVAGTLITSFTIPVCMDLPVGSYTAIETGQTGWVSSDPGGATPQKPFTIGSGQPANLLFGNYQIPLP